MRTVNLMGPLGAFYSVVCAAIGMGIIAFPLLVVPERWEWILKYIFILGMVVIVAGSVLWWKTLPGRKLQGERDEADDGVNQRTRNPWER